MKMTFSYRYVGRDDAKKLAELVRDTNGLEPIVDEHGSIASAWEHLDFLTDYLSHRAN